MRLVCPHGYPVHHLGPVTPSVHRSSRDRVATVHMETLSAGVAVSSPAADADCRAWDKVITSSGSRFCFIATQSIRGDRNNWNVHERWIGINAARRLVAI